MEMPVAVQGALKGLVRCDRLVVAPEVEDREAFRLELQEVSRMSCAASLHPPRPQRSWAEARAALREVLAPTNLPSGAVVVVGTQAEDAAWAEAADMARFLPAEVCLPAPA